MVSDLQLSLIAAGAAGVAAVWCYNIWVERRHRRIAQRILGESYRDVLMNDQDEPVDGAATVGNLENSDRLEPVVADFDDPEDAVPEVAEAPPETMLVAEPDASLCDPGIDIVLALETRREIPFARLLELHNALARSPAKPQACLVCDGAMWHVLEPSFEGGATQIRYVLQMADRRGAIPEAELQAALAGLRVLAEEFSGTLGAVNPESCLSQAQALDGQCAAVDVQIAVHLVPSGEARFGGERLRELFENAGLRIAADGNFYRHDEAGQVQFSVTNDGAVPFVEETLPQLSTDGITFWLDVPRVGDGGGAFDRMVAVARTLAGSLGGTLVDDQRRTLGDRELAGIRAKIVEIHAMMEQAGIPAGAMRAQRLFV